MASALAVEGASSRVAPVTAPPSAAASAPAPATRVPYAPVGGFDRYPRPAPTPSGGSALAPGLAPPPTSLNRAFDAIAVPEAKNAGVRSIVTNNEAWLAAWNIMDTAKERVDASYYIFNRDVFGRAFLGQLLRKQRAGVPVRLLLDATGDSFGRMGFTSTGRGQDYLQEIVGAGGKVRVYNPLHLKLPKQIADMSSANVVSANHDKIVASERYGMTGGRNIAAHYFTSPADDAGVYRDADIVVDSPVAAERLSRAVRAEFDRDDLTFEIRPDMFGNWSSKAGELLGTAAMMDLWLQRTPFSEADKTRLRGSEEARNALADELIEQVRAQATRKGEPVPSRGELLDSARELAKNVDLAGKGRNYSLNRGMRPGDVKIVDRTSVASGARGHDEIAPALAALVDGAEERLLITNPYVVLSERVREKLEAAGKRGVRIDLLTNSPASTDSAVTQAFFLRQWPGLLARIPNLHIYVFAGEHKLHAKSGFADDRVGMVGSFNLDILSSDINGEAIGITRSPAVVRELANAFHRDMVDPKNNVLEYTIKRDAEGKPILRNGEPIVEFGPENHVSPNAMRFYRAMSSVADYATKRMPQLSPLTESQPISH